MVYTIISIYMIVMPRKIRRLFLRLIFSRMMGYMNQYDTMNKVPYAVEQDACLI